MLYKKGFKKLKKEWNEYKELKMFLYEWKKLLSLENECIKVHKVVFWSLAEISIQNISKDSKQKEFKLIRMKNDRNVIVLVA